MGYIIREFMQEMKRLSGEDFNLIRPGKGKDPITEAGELADMHGEFILRRGYTAVSTSFYFPRLNKDGNKLVSYIYQEKVQDKKPKELTVFEVAHSEYKYGCYGAVFVKEGRPYQVGEHYAKIGKEIHRFAYVDGFFHEGYRFQASRIGLISGSVIVDPAEKYLPAPPWARLVQSETDMYKSPLNEKYWEEFPFLEPDTLDCLYTGLNLIVYRTKTVLICLGGTWVRTDLSWLEHELDSLPENLQAEYVLFKEATDF